MKNQHISEEGDEVELGNRLTLYPPGGRSYAQERRILE